MKKISGILLGMVLLFSCSSNDKEEAPAPTVTYGVRTEKDCPNGTPVSSQISKETYDYIKSITLTGACNWITVKDIDGVTISGYLVSYGSPYSK